MRERSNKKREPFRKNTLNENDQDRLEPPDKMLIRIEREQWTRFLQTVERARIRKAPLIKKQSCIACYAEKCRRIPAGVKNGVVRTRSQNNTE